MLVDVLLVVGDEGLGDGLADGVDLGGVATAGDADADVDVGELVEADDEEGLVDLEAEDLRLHEGEGAAVDLDETATSLIVSHVSNDEPKMQPPANVPLNDPHGSLMASLRKHMVPSHTTRPMKNGPGAI